MKNLAIITTHPVQYNSPLFKLIAQRGRIGLRVFYTWPQAIEGFDDPDFGVKVKWDLPLLDGYDYELVENISQNPGSRTYGGIDNPSLIERIEHYEPDAILVYGWKLKSHLNAMRHFKGRIPVWFRGDSTLLDFDVRSLSQITRGRFLSDIRQYLKYRLRRLALTWVYRHVDKAFYVGTNSKEYFLTHGLKDNQLVYAPHAIDNDRFAKELDSDSERQLSEWKQICGFNADDFVLLYCGKFEPRKNLVFFMETVLSLMRSESDLSRLKIVLFGNGPQEKLLRKMSSNSDNVVFLPFQNQLFMPAVYRLGHFFCLPSQSETWGLVVNEAMACGCPVLVSNKVGCAVDLANSEPHRIFESGNMESLKSAILDAYQNRNAVDGVQIQAFIRHWSFQAVAEALEEEMMKIEK